MLVIEDVPGRQHQCDALLDQNFLPEGREPYAGLVPEGALVLLGPEFALLREEFSRMRESTTPRSGRLKRVLVFFTSGDDSGETLKALRGIEMAGLSLQVDVVLGTNQSDFTEIKRICARKGWKVYRHVDFMHHLISEADLVIGSGGSSNWERCALGAPAIVAVLAENQQALALALNRYGAVVCIGRKELTTPERYRDELRSLTERSIHEMSVAALSLVDGRGARRVSEALIAMCASKGGLTEVNRV
jgi:UDP-2,4-diacetamido-2,4,6-trideoxy-beta-L-altropyranose hydrolase